MKIQNGTANNLTSTGLTVRATVGGTAEVFAIYDTNGNKFVSVKTNTQGGTFMLGTNTQGTLSVSNNAANTNSSFQSGNNAPSIYLGPAGNVGIQQSAPTNALDVVGNADVTGNLMIGGGITNTGTFRFNGDMTSANDFIFTRGVSVSIRAGAGNVAVGSQLSLSANNASNPDTPINRVAVGVPGVTNVFLYGTNITSFLTGVSAMGATLGTDGTNLLVVFQNAAGTRTTNKLSMASWP